MIESNHARLRVLECIASLHEAAAGTTVYLNRLAILLRDADIEPVVLAAGLDGDTDAPARLLPPDPPGRGPLARLVSKTRPSRALRDALREEALTVDVIHTHGLWLLPNVYPGEAATRAGVPLIVSPHGMLGRGALQFSRFSKLMFWAVTQRRAVANAFCWHATSHKEMEDIRAFGIRAPVAVVPIGIDLPAQSAVPAQRSKEVLFLGRLHAKKGLDSLLRVWPPLAARYPDWTLRIVGPLDTQADRYRAKAADMANVTIEDAVFGERKWACYRRAALFVLPTVDENFGITVAEALAAETPVVCSDGAPWSKLVEHNAGWWVRQGDIALENALSEAMALPEPQRRVMGERGRAWMGQDFTWQSVVSQMAQLYRWTARKGGRPDFVHLR